MMAERAWEIMTDEEKYDVCAHFLMNYLGLDPADRETARNVVLGYLGPDDMYTVLYGVGSVLINGDKTLIEGRVEDLVATDVTVKRLQSTMAMLRDAGVLDAMRYKFADNGQAELYEKIVELDRAHVA